MADDKSKAGAPDRARINTGEDYEVREWAQKFGVSEDELTAAVVAVGPMAADVEAYLQRGKKQ